MNAADVVEIEQLILHERQGRDRGRWQQMREAFAPDSSVRLSWYRGDGPGFVDGSEQMSARGDRAVHRLSPPVVHVNGDRGLAELSCAIEFAVRLDDVPAYLVSYARLYYRVVRTDRWRIVRLDPVYEHDAIAPAFPGDTIAVREKDVAGLRPSYALLAYNLSQKGYPAADDLMGDDRPDEVEAFMAESFAWLGAGVLEAG